MAIGIWRKPDIINHLPNFIPMMTHSGGMLWGCSLAAGTGRLGKTEGRSNRSKYRDILEETYEHSGHHENDPKQHRSTQEWLQNKSVNALD